MSLDEFYIEYDISMDVDLLGHIFIHDPYYQVCTPGFEKIEDLETYVQDNLLRFMDLLERL